MRRSMWLVAGLALALASGCGPQAADPAPESGGDGAPPAGVEGVGQDAGDTTAGDGAGAEMSAPMSGDERATEVEAESAQAPATVAVEAAPTDGDEGAAEVETAEITVERPPIGELRATDPSAVALGAGTPQLVEFFAFW